MGNKKRATCLATLQQNELYSDVARFTTNIKLVLQQIRLLTGLNVGCKTRNITIQLVLQQCCETRCTFFFSRFSVPLQRKKRFWCVEKPFPHVQIVGRKAKWQKLPGGKGTAVLFSVYLSVSFFY